MNKDMSKKRVSETNFCGGLCLPHGGLAGLPPTRKKRAKLPALKGFFKDIGANVHACITKMTPNEQKTPQNKYEKNRRQT